MKLSTILKKYRTEENGEDKSLPVLKNITFFENEGHWLLYIYTKEKCIVKKYKTLCFDIVSNNLSTVINWDYKHSYIAFYDNFYIHVFSNREYHTYVFSFSKNR